MSEMRYRLGPKFPDYPGGRKTYRKFQRIDNVPPDDLKKLRELLRLTGQELRHTTQITKELGDDQFTRRMQVRQFSSVLDSFFAVLNYYSLAAESRGDIVISKKDHRRILGRLGIWESYKASIKLFAKTMGMPNPNSDELQIRGPAEYWPDLRGRIMHPRSLELYHVNACDLGILRAIAAWFQNVQSWSLRLELKNIDNVQEQISRNFDDLRTSVMKDSNN
jgi:hypothetical protein